MICISAISLEPSISSVRKGIQGFLLSLSLLLLLTQVFDSCVATEEEKERAKNLDPLPDRRYRGSSEIAEMQIMTWLNLNIKEPRDFRQTQLYIYGPPKMGKSTLIRNLNNYLSIYYVPRDDGEFCDEYEDGIYDLIVLDEFTNKKTMQWMNQLLDGQTCYLKKKGGQILKKDNLPVIILSNFSLEQNYPRLNESGMLEPLISRLKIVNVQSFINVPFRDQ